MEENSTVIFIFQKKKKEKSPVFEKHIIFHG